jgi:hypothetical protein
VKVEKVVENSVVEMEEVMNLPDEVVKQEKKAKKEKKSVAQMMLDIKEKKKI